MKERCTDWPDGWESVTIDDVVVPKVQQGAPNTAFTYIDIGSVNNKTKQIESAKELAAGSKIPSRAQQHVRPGDILVSMTRPNLNAVAKVPTELDGAICSTGFEVLQPIEVEPDWLFLVVKSRPFIEEMASLVQGALYPAVRPADVRAYKFAIPPLAEQRRIVAKIEALQERSRRVREALAEVVPLLEQFRQSVLAAAFHGDLTAHWRAAHPNVEPASELLHRIHAERRRRWEQAELARYEAQGQKPPKNLRDRYKEPESVDDSELPELPEGWCWTTVDELTMFVTSGSRRWAKYYSAAGPLFIRAQNLNTDRLMMDDIAHVTPPLGSEGERTRVMRNDFLITITGANVAKAAYVDIDIDEAYVSQHVALVRLVQPTLAKYLHLWMISPTNGRSQLLADAYGNGKPGLNLDNIRKMAVALPPTTEQVALLAMVEEMLHKTDLLGYAAKVVENELDQLDQSILAKAFRGELVLQDPNDEPASVLLQRIREQKAQQVEAANGHKRTTKTQQGNKMGKNRQG